MLQLVSNLELVKKFEKKDSLSFQDVAMRFLAG